MTEVQSLSEYRSLLRDRSNAPLYHRIKHACMIQSTERRLIAAVLVCFTIGVAFIAIKESFINSLSKGDILNTDEETLWHYKTNEEKEEFLRLWNNANETLLSVIALYDEQENGKYNDRSKDFTLCELILETVKRSLQKCVSLEILPDICKRLLPKKIECSKDLHRHRAWDGSCNNLRHTDWGMAGRSFNRWLKATYADDVSIPRQSVFGGKLPPVRYLSNLLYSHKTLPDSNVTMFFAHFGLFLDHDIVQVGQAKGNYSSCCEKDPSLRHPSCLRITNLEDDPLYGPLNVTCKGFLRSPPFTGVCPGRREQENRMTAYLDISDVYASSHDEGDKLLSKKGLMRTSTVHHTPLLPKSKDSGTACYAKQANFSCFRSGDIRVNLLMPLMTMHTMWLREHNRIASQLGQINPMWDDNTLFLETRRIVIAEYQHIIYKEFLPIIFGARRMKELGLRIEEDKDYDGYDENIDAGIHHAFAGAAFRFGHTLIQSQVQLRDKNYSLKAEIPLHETYMNPTLLYNGGYDDVVRGMIMQKAQIPDHYTTEELRGRLLQKFDMTNGYDLTAMSLLRARDHGIAPYLKWRKFCKLPVPNSWEDLKNWTKKEYVQTLQEAYRSIEDIDLAPGAMGEQHLEGSLLGPTYICLLGKQFSNLRKGDRFWYENLNHAGAFTKDQLKELYKVTYARILCDTSDDIRKVPKHPFLTTSNENPFLNCDEIQQVDLSLWREY